MFVFTKDATAMDAMEDCVEFVLLVRKSSIVIKNIWTLLATGALRDVDGLSGRSKNGQAIATITWGGSKDTPEQMGTGNRWMKLYRLVAGMAIQSR